MPRSRLTSLALALGVSIPLSAVNPFGIQALLFAIGTLTSPLIQNNIQEWASPDFHSIAGLMLEAVLFIMIAGLATRRVRARTSELLLTLALLYLALSSQRHVGLFVLGAALIVGRSAQALLESLPDRVSAARLQPRRNPGAALGLLNLALLLVIGAGMIVYRALPGLEPASEAAAIRRTMPVDAVSALQRLQRPMRIFNDYAYGGYLIWTLYPSGGRVFIDGRVEVYGPAIFRDYLQVDYLAPSWQAVITQARPDVIILPTGHPLVALLEEDSAWQQFSRDSVATVLTRVGFHP